MQKKLECRPYVPNLKDKRGNKRLDKLFQNRKYEKEAPNHRRMNESQNDNHYMETMENKSQKGMGIT